MEEKQNSTIDEELKEYFLPVTWSVWDKVSIKAHSLEEAISILKRDIDTIPLSTEPEYVEDSYQMDDGNGGDASIEETIRYLKEIWPSSLEAY